MSVSHVMVQQSGTVNGGTDASGTSATIFLGDYTNGVLIAEASAGAPSLQLQASVDGTYWVDFGSSFNKDEPQNLVPDGKRLPMYRVTHSSNTGTLIYHVHRCSMR